MSRQQFSLEQRVQLASRGGTTARTLGRGRKRAGSGWTSSSGGSRGRRGRGFPILPSPGPRRAVACWQRRERSGRRRLGECLICGIPQIIRAAGNVGQGWRIPSPASAPDAAGGRKGSGGEGNPGALLQRPPRGRETHQLPWPCAPPSSSFGGLLERGFSGSCTLSALVWARNAAGQLLPAVPALGCGTFPRSLASLTSASPISHELSQGSRCPNATPRVSACSSPPCICRDSCSLFGG